GRLLLELAVGGDAPLRAAAAAVSHPTLQRRLQMLRHPARPFRPAWAWSLVLLGLGVLAPVRLTAREAGSPLQAPAPAQAGVAAPRPAPAPSADPQPQPAPRPRREGEPKPLQRHHGSAFIYLRSADETTMDGDVDDIPYRRYQQNREPMIWLRRQDQEWVIRDRELLARVDALWEPMRRLGAQQAELGKRQAELGAQQAGLGSHQADLGSQQAELGSKQASLSTLMASCRPPRRASAPASTAPTRSSARR
ncbi:MAG TPA: hypothetical protein VGV61_18475, partial [Thermoanaerobaculia bacterium]|nr:hypothetical protein [Thermoanaerobaculia bacterium]